jgi:DNA-binding MarR family transcriptional regulator
MMETLKDLWASMVAYVNERTTNPLTSAFLLSWAAWNYKFFVLLFSDESPAEKFQAIEALYPRPDIYWSGGLLYPALTAIFYVFFYPYITAWVVTFYRGRQVAIANSLKIVEGKRVRDVEEVTRLIRAHEKELQSVNADLASSRQKVEGLQRALSGAESELISAKELLATARSSVPPERAGTVRQVAPLISDAAEHGSMDTDDEPIALSEGTEIGKLERAAFNRRQLKLLTLLTDRSLYPDGELKQASGLKPFWVDEELTKLSARGLVIREAGYWEITEKGRQVLRTLIAEKQWIIETAADGRRSRI